jgi:transposase
LQQYRIRTVAMESTGAYWIPLMQILEARGLEVYLVNAKHAKKRLRLTGSRNITRIPWAARQKGTFLLCLDRLC